MPLIWVGNHGKGAFRGKDNKVSYGHRMPVSFVTTAQRKPQWFCRSEEKTGLLKVGNTQFKTDHVFTQEEVS